MDSNVISKMLSFIRLARAIEPNVYLTKIRCGIKLFTSIFGFLQSFIYLIMLI